jgi:hypothetical protein
VSLPVLVATESLAGGLTIAQSGVALCTLAVLAAGVHLLLPVGDGSTDPNPAVEDPNPRGRLALVDATPAAPLLGILVAAATAGIALASTDVARGDLTMASVALLLLSSIGFAYAGVHRSIEGAVFASIGATLGVWGLLLQGHVTALDAYLAPVAVAFAFGGWLAMRSRTAPVSSWVAFGPSIVMLGGSALLARIDGGPGVHAVVAGAVGIAAVLLGGGRRLAGPLLLGTALLVAVVGHESLDVTRGVPTWAWLALGGAVLLGAGVVMERRDTGPLETGRRLVDVVHERFT